MIRTQLRLPENAVLESLLPRLKRRVFHVTNSTNLNLILNDGEIRPNVDRSYESAFGNYNSFFRNRNCVSLFDYRTITDEQLEDSIIRCNPVEPIILSPGSGLTIFLLSERCCPDLLPWSMCDNEKAWHEMVVPHVEAGHRGSLSLELVDELLCVEIDENPDPLVAKLRAARKQSDASE